jgi:hypothetical protein
MDIDEHKRKIMASFDMASEGYDVPVCGFLPKALRG